MNDRLLVGVLGNRNSGKSHTWNTLFSKTVKTGIHPRYLKLFPDECVEVFLISGSPEERKLYAGRILQNQDCRIVLCSLQYTMEVRKSINFFIEKRFQLYIQWLNPGRNDQADKPVWDNLGIATEILSLQSTLTIRNGKVAANERVQEIREFIYGWAKFRDLLIPC